MRINTSMKNVAEFYDSFILYLSIVTLTVHATEMEVYHIKIQEGEGTEG
jgi:hypothetical protein